ncbi:MAG: ferrochelatase [Legionellaceae bacterium]|nr:ferrochelatase [Legionellaceae bacterium]
MTKGLLLINLGTPDNPNTTSVRQYLREFLADKRVIDLPLPLRYALLYGFILPTRTRQTIEAYQSIWTEQGSPLRYHSTQLCHTLQKELGEDYRVVIGMRYGNPSLLDALHSLRTCEHITVLPLYPQYSSAATGSSIEYVLKAIASQTVFPSLNIIRDFHQHPGFIQAQAHLIKPYLTDHDHLVLSYHGLPERHLQQSGCQKVCIEACPSTTERSTNQSCYRAQCYQTTASIAHALDLKLTFYNTGFQSRLGRTPWIKPYTDALLLELINRGITRLAIACPSFVADCLETLEEIGIRARAQWQQLGGKQLTLIPCLNDHELWIKAIIEGIKCP